MCANPVPSFTHQSQERKVRGRIDRAGYEKIRFHMNTSPSPTQLGFGGSSPRVPEIMDWYALEDGDENVGDGETDNKMVAPQEDAAELNAGEDAVLEENATNLNSLDIIICIAH